MGLFDRLKKKPKSSFDIYGEEVVNEFVHNPDPFVLEMLKAEGKPPLPVVMGNFSTNFLDRSDGTSFTTTIKQYVEMKERLMAEKEPCDECGYFECTEECGCESCRERWRHGRIDTNNPASTDEKTHLEWIRLAHGCSLDEAKQIVHDFDNGIDSDILRKYGIGHK